MAIMSIMGLYDYDDTIFNEMKIPAGINRDTVITTILADCAELEILYPSTYFIKNMISIWSENRFYTWNELYKTTQYEYNAIENYDRKEEWNTTNNGSGESVGKTNGFDSDELVDVNGSNTTINNKETRTGRTHGNIGVTTTQQMIKEQRAIVDFDIVQFIADDFKKRFCLLIY